jgi:hypothetical protein
VSRSNPPFIIPIQNHCFHEREKIWERTYASSLARNDQFLVGLEVVILSSLWHVPERLLATTIEEQEKQKSNPVKKTSKTCLQSLDDYNQGTPKGHNGHTVAKRNEAKRRKIDWPGIFQKIVT